MIRRLCVALAVIGASLVGDVQLAAGQEIRFGAKLRTDLQRQVEAQEELLARKAEASLRSFYRQQWKIVERLQPRVDNWHVDAICDHLQATVADVGQRPDITRLVINVPPRNSKSSTTCVALPAWVWGPRNLPGRKFMFVTHGLKLARRDSISTRRVITSDWYRTNWGDRFKLVGDQNAKDRYDNDQTGYRMIGSFRGGSVIGEGADFLPIDDPLDPEKADNANELERIIETYDGALVARLNDQVRGVIILIMQRLAENDLCGHVLKQAGWTHLSLPAEFEVENRCRTFIYVGVPMGNQPNDSASTGEVVTASHPSDPKDVSGRPERTPENANETATSRVIRERPDGEPTVKLERVLFFEDPRTEEGELLNPKRFPREALDLLRGNDWVYAAQQQQRPAPRGGQILQELWWNYYDELPRDTEGKPRKPDHGAQSWDLAFKDLKTSDFVGALAAQLYGADIYIIDYRMERLSFTATCDAMREWNTKHPQLPAKLVEDKANGPAVADALKQEVPGIILVEPQGGKIARAFAAQPTLKARNVYLPNPTDPQTGKIIPERAWVKKFVANCAVFPKGRHDDDVDAFTQLVTYLRGTHNAMLEFMKQMKARDEARARKEREGRG